MKFGLKKGDKSDSESDDDDDDDDDGDGDGGKRKFKLKGPKLPSFGLKFGGKKGKKGDSGSDSEDDDDKKLKLKGPKLDVDTPKLKGGDGDLNLGIDVDSGDKSIEKDVDFDLKEGMPDVVHGNGSGKKGGTFKDYYGKRIKVLISQHYLHLMVKVFTGRRNPN